MRLSFLTPLYYYWYIAVILIVIVIACATQKVWESTVKLIKALHGRLKSQRDGTGGKLTVDPPFSFRRECGTGKI